MKLEGIDITGLEVFSAPYDVRRDLHIYIDFVRGQEIKRHYRTNQLKKGDARQLARAFGHPDVMENVEDRNEYFGNSWIDKIEYLALRLKLVNFDTAGEYGSYTSMSATYRDNYVIVHKKTYEEFLTLSLAEQERRILATYVDLYEYDRNEFFDRNYWGMLDRFSIMGSATGPLPSVDFAEARSLLLETLAECDPGEWLSTASLVAYFKAHHPYFLIPENPLTQRGYGKPEPVSRYKSFYENIDRWNRDGDLIPDDAPDGFERVEGRYIERFLEGIPLLLGYVDVAYREDDPIHKPSINRLAAFRVRERFTQMMRDELPAPRVTVQPNFEVVVESAFYPVASLERLKPIGEIVSEGAVSTLKLEREKVAAMVAWNEDFDPVAILRELAEEDLPPNVVIELEEWAGHAEIFTLYDGFGLVEGEGKLPESLIAHEIGPGLRLVRDPRGVYAQLHRSERVPIYVAHQKDALTRLPEGAETAFPSGEDAAPRPEVTVKRETFVRLTFSDREAMAVCRKALLDARCPVESDEVRRTLTLPGQYKPQIDAALESLHESYDVTLEGTA